MSRSQISLAPRPALVQDLWADAEREVTKLRGLLVRHLCDCRPMATSLPIEPVMHSPKCTYRREMQ